jgi:6-pyruvoyltetrahydropterin/6-carboxytetrahydropterin synthase
MFTIRKQFSFEAAHHLVGLHKDHPCMRQHGHSYRVEVTLQSETLNDVGFIVDYRELDELKQYIDRKFDHKDLNDVVEITTAESLAKHFFFFCRSRWPLVTKVGVSETQKTWAEYSSPSFEIL